MKKVILFCVSAFFITVSLTSDVKKDDQINNGMFVCPQYYLPVCGSDGKTYGNECILNGTGLTKDCDQACPCPDKSKPDDPPGSDSCSRPCSCSIPCSCPHKIPKD